MVLQRRTGAGPEALSASARAALAWTRPGAILGLEQEFTVRRDESRVDFRALIKRLDLPGARIDPGDRHARRLLSGIVITADAREAEVALPPLRRRRGYARTLSERRDLAVATLLGALPANHSLEGYSTHISVSMPDALNDAVCLLYARTFSAAAILLMDARESDGILIRPRPGRTELGVDYLRDGWLRVATVFAVASLRACAARVQGEDVELPPELRVRVDDGVERYGWFVARDAFGSDLVHEGRGARLATVDRQILTGQDTLQAAWDAVQPWLDAVDAADLDLASRIVGGGEPLPGEVERREIVSVARQESAPRTHRAMRTPFGAVLRTRTRGPLRVDAHLSTWDYTVFRVAEPGRPEVFVSVPSATLGTFLADIDHGRLDIWLKDALDCRGDGRSLVSWDQTRQLGVYAQLGSSTALVRPERAPVGGEGVSGDRAGKIVETGIVKPEETDTGRPPWVLIGGLLIGGIILIGGLIGFTVLGGGGNQASPTPSAPEIAQSPTPAAVITPGAVVTPTPTPFAFITPSPSPALPIEVTSIDEFLQSVGVDETLRTELGGLITLDETSDWNETNTALDPAEVDIVSSLTFEASIGSDFLAQFPACGQGLICASDATGLPGTSIGAPGDYYVYLMQSRGPILGALTTDTGYFEMGVVNFDFTPAGGGDPVAFDLGASNFLTGSNTAYSLRWVVPTEELSGAMFRLIHGENDPFFHGEASTGFGVVRGNVLAVFIPETEWDGAADFRLYSYYQSQTLGAVSDTSPDMTEPMTPYVPGFSFPLGETVVSPSTRPTSLSMNNSFGDLKYGECSVTGTITWTPSQAGAAVTGSGSIQIEGPTLAGTEIVAAANNAIELRLKFQWTSAPRTWTITLTSVNGQPVTPAPAGANGSQFGYSATGGPNC